jgi:ZIP family zinc transporter
MDSFIQVFSSYHPILQALLAGLFTWGLTAIGASMVFFFKGSNRKFLDTALGFTGGVMIAASFWSLLEPSINYVELQNDLRIEQGLKKIPSFLPPAIGFFLGALFLYFLDKKIPHLHLFEKVEKAEGPKTNLKKTELLVLAIGLHNIPEGLAVGVTFGALAQGMDVGVGMAGAIALAIGMGIQNAPEGFAVSMPLRRQGLSKWKSWQWGQLSAIVEPIFAVIGAAIVMTVLPILPYALAFAAGAMIFIVVEEVIPESQRGGNTDLATMGLIVGFIVMMILDVSLHEAFEQWLEQNQVNP